VLVTVRACEHVVPEVKKEEVQKQESGGTEAKRRGRKACELDESFLLPSSVSFFFHLSCRKG